MNRKEASLLFAIVFALSSCSLYKSSSINSPLLNEKGDAQIKFSTLSNAELSAVYAFSDKLAVMVDAANTGTYPIRYKNEMDVVENSLLLNYKVDGGVGWYNSERNEKGFQGFAGYSYGRASTLANNILKTGNNSMLRTSFLGPYFQLSYRVQLKEKTHLNFLSKSNYYRFYDFENVGDYQTGSLKEGDDFFIQQFGVELKQVREKVNTNFQVIYADYYGATSNFTVRGLSVHFGIAYRLNKKQKD